MNEDTKKWERLNHIFETALEKYPHSQHALHWLWNHAIADSAETMKPPPPPPMNRWLSER